MNDAPTPETDAVHLKQGLTHAEYRRHAQRLESERDFERKFNSQIMEGNTRITKERDKALRYAENAKSYKKALKNENNELRRERDSLTDQRDFAQNLIRILERERDEAKNEILGWKNKWDCAIEMAARAENALDEMTLRWERTNDALFDERALADRLARIVEYGIEDMDEEEPEFLADAKKALTAWKEARK